MLQTLHIHGLALIDTAEICLARGLNVISGETGGGKSLVVTALKLLRGERAAASLVRHGANDLRVDAEFVLDGASERSRACVELVHELCGVDLEDDLLVVSRSVDEKGRSKVRVNGRPTTLAVLRTLGSHLLEIHGQGESRALMRPETQSETLDAFGGITALRHAWAQALGAARSAAAAVEAATANERDRLERIEFLRFQKQEMDAVGLAEGEVEQLEHEHRLLANLDAMRERLDDVAACLTDAEASASDLLGRAKRALVDAAAIDGELTAAVDRVDEALVHVEEAARIAQSRRGDLDLDPARLADVDDRLSTLRRALVRFGPDEASFRSNLAAVTGELDELEAAVRDPATLRAEADARLEQLVKAATKLVRARRKAASAFHATIERELADLVMKDTRFEVAFDDVDGDPTVLLADATEHGPSPVDFTVRINPGEPFQSMRETASGGEMARIVLAVKKTLADQDRVPFLVFDEIDAEIGGRLGLQVGRKLKEVASDHQVLIVTHLPQVAAFADAHFKVAKQVEGERTRSTVISLDDAASERELAAMAAGDGADGDAVAEARRLVQRARAATEATGEA